MALGQPRFVDMGPLTIAGLMRRYTPDTLSQLPTQWSALQGEVGGVVGRIGGDVYGVWYDVLKGGRDFGYLAGAPVGEFAPIHPGLSRAFIPAQRYAVFLHQGHVSEIRSTMDAVLSQWLPSSGRRVAHFNEAAPDFVEHYSEEFAKTRAGPIDIWLPIEK